MHSRSVRAFGLAAFIALAAACSPAAPTGPADSGGAASIGPSGAGGGPSIGPSDGPSPSSLACTHQFRVGLVGQPGSLADNGYNQSATAGLDAASAAAPSCFRTDAVASKTVGDAAKDLQAYAEGGYDVVIGVGQSLGDALGDVAGTHPNVRFIGVDAAPGPTHDSSWQTNGESLFFAEDQQGYLAGVLAALVSHTRNIGVVGGLLLVPQVESSVEGFLHGAAATVPGITVQFAYTTSFSDPAQGRAAATAMIAKGADVIFSSGSATGDGALLAACKAGVTGDRFRHRPGAQPAGGCPMPHLECAEERHGRPDRGPRPAGQWLVHARLPHRRRGIRRDPPGPWARPGRRPLGRQPGPPRCHPARPGRRLAPAERGDRRQDALRAGPLSARTRAAARQPLTYLAELAPAPARQVRCHVRSPSGPLAPDPTACSIPHLPPGGRAGHASAAGAIGDHCVLADRANLGGTMRIRSTGVALFAGVALIVSACSGRNGRPFRRRPRSAAVGRRPPRHGASRQPRRRRRRSRSASSPTSAR